MGANRTLVLVRSEEALQILLGMVEQLPGVRGRAFEFDILRGEPSQAMSERREQEGNIPIGVIAEDEPTALAALSGGADEALVLPELSTASVVTFIDRTEFRAGLRVETHRLHERFAHTEKLTALGTLVAGVGHEINNPLSAVLLLLEAGRREILPAMQTAWEVVRLLEQGERVPESLVRSLSARLKPTRDGVEPTRIFDEIGSASDAIAGIVRDLRVFARTDEEEALELVTVPDLMDHTIRLLGRDLFKRCLIERDYASNLPSLVIPRNRVTQVLMNVLVNATHAISEVERPMHRVSISARADEEFVAIAISDTGVGIPPKSLERIFDPFFTTKRKEMGTGLGLSISRSIVRRLGGELSVESVYGEGATFICFLPIPTRDMLRSAFKRTVIRARDTSASSSMRVLVVEDDVQLLRSYARLLGASHRMIVAHDGREAVDLLESGSGADIALLELDLLDIGDGSLLDWLQTHRPELARRTVLVTSMGSAPEHAELLHQYPGKVLHKPMRGEIVLETIARLANPSQPPPVRERSPTGEERVAEERVAEER
ncbi:MAG: ATP-binding protein [Myxococcales bacterium]